MKTKLWLVLTSLLFVATTEAQTFGLTLTNINIAGVSRLALKVVGASGDASFGLEQSSDGVTFTPATGWVTSSIDGRPAFVRITSSSTGYYYRATTVLNSVTVTSTNTPPVVELHAAVVAGNRAITVIGPPGTYNLEASNNLQIWTLAIAGVPQQTNFVDFGVATRYYRAIKVQ